METDHGKFLMGRVVGLAMVALLAGCQTLSPVRKDEAEKEWMNRARDGASELAKNTGSSQQINWDSLPTTPPK